MWGFLWAFMLTLVGFFAWFEAVGGYLALVFGVIVLGSYFILLTIGWIENDV